MVMPTYFSCHINKTIIIVVVVVVVTAGILMLLFTAVAHQERKSPVDMSSARMIGPAAPSLWSSSATTASNT